MEAGGEGWRGGGSSIFKIGAGKEGGRESAAVRQLPGSPSHPRGCRGPFPNPSSYMPVGLPFFRLSEGRVQERLRSPMESVRSRGDPPPFMSQPCLPLPLQTAFPPIPDPGRLSPLPLGHTHLFSRLQIRTCTFDNSQPHLQ